MTKHFFRFLLTLSMIFSLIPAVPVLAATHAYTSSVMVEEPVEGNRPVMTGTSNNNNNYNKPKAKPATVVSRVEWSGELDQNGCFKAGVAYTVTVTEEISQDFRGEKKNFYFKDNRALINKKAAVIVSLTDDNRSITASYTFPVLKSNAQVAEDKAREESEKRARQEAREEKAHADEVTRRWSLAQADANYPLGQPLTVVVSEDNVDMARISQWRQWSGWTIEERGSRISNVLEDTLYTLDGEVITNKDLPRIHQYYHDTFNTYRITRVVYDLYRKIDFSLAEEINVKEFWLSPKCDIQGILDNIGRESYAADWGGDRDRFATYDHILFIPDSLYPNGPTYTEGCGVPGCRVMLYSGDDVYAAARKGVSAARDWCTNHSYTARIVTPDRLYNRGSCQIDELFYYSCSRCGLCENNPNHTFYYENSPADMHQDNGQYTAHVYNQKVVSDEHFLGINESGDRVYLYACRYCGIDNRQSQLRSGNEGHNKTWTPGGPVYNNAIKATPEKDGPHHTFAIAADKFVTAKTSDESKKRVQDASNHNLIDKELLGQDYTINITRLQLASIAVKMTEKMTGRAITPAPVGSLTDTDNLYALKAYAAGITGNGSTAFDPNGIADRQTMAAFFYQALMYVKNNSDTRYTVYASKLDSFTDSGEVADWARPGMDFMTGLGLMKSSSQNTLSPYNPCTIQEALIVANYSLDAGGIGWHQCVKSVKAFSSYTNMMVHYAYGDRIWFTSSSGSCIDPYGRQSAVNPKDFYSIKDQ